MKISESLEQAKKKIINEQDWFPGYNRSNEEVHKRFSNRQCHCALTAIDDSNYDYYACLNIMRQALKIVDPSIEGTVSVSFWNDSTTHENVMKAYGVAIELAKELECQEKS